MSLYLNRFFIPFVTFLIILVVALILRTLVMRALRHWASRNNDHLDELIVQAIRLPSLFLCLALGLYLAVAFSELPSRYAFYVSKVIYLVIILFGGHRVHPYLREAFSALHPEL